ncbi:hypothetical protein AGMMS49983_05720 [Clostridia bacterium]|nr:hypothetical protein AGMMS49983_05720 [Clostridia bacterium]
MDNAKVSIAELDEKKAILFGLAPFSDGVKRLKRKTDLRDFVYTNLKLYGSALTHGGVERVLEGVTVPGVPVFEHRLCEAHRKLLSRFESKIEMDIEVDSIVLNEFCGILCGSDFTPYRTGAPCLYHLDFVPGDPECISADLAEAFKQIARTDFAADICRKAAAVHGAIVNVYPYADSFSEMAARTAMQYELVKGGYFPVDLELSEPDYNTIIAQAVKSGNPAPLADVLRTAIFRKLHMLIDAVERGV